MSAMSSISNRIHRKGLRVASKRHPGKTIPGKLHSTIKIGPGKIVSGKRFPSKPHPPPCDNSNDSGFGFDQHVEIQQQPQHFTIQESQGNIHTHASTCDNSRNSTNSLSNGFQKNDVIEPLLINNHQQKSLSAETTLPSSSSTDSTSAIAIALALQQQQQHQSIPQHFTRLIPASRSNKLLKKSKFPQNGDNIENNSDNDLDKYSAHHNNTIDTTQLNLISSPPLFTVNPALNCITPLTQHIDSTNIDGKRTKIESIPVELIGNDDDACSEDAFIRKIASGCSNSMFLPISLRVQNSSASPLIKFASSCSRGIARVAHKRQPINPQYNVATSLNGQIRLEIISQPEQQHRARYQTEGSRGAVKDRSGNGFPIVRLIGYNKPAVLQVFIGTDVGRVVPHMFYQACKVAGKNSTQCNEKKVDGTVVIEIDFKPDQDMTINCDCVGILKERNVDVEHRFPEHLTQKNKKKSTRCRMVFRTQLILDDGNVETLQVCSNPIICTQPPGLPEICKKSLNSCPVDGGLELFIIGKNFLKDTHVIFQELCDNIADDQNSDDINGLESSQTMNNTHWKHSVIPDKEYLQQNHLICIVPPYVRQNIMKPVTVQLSIISSGKMSESHSFDYTPKGSYTILSAASALHPHITRDNITSAQENSLIKNSNGINMHWSTIAEAKEEMDADMMPPPITTQIPIGVRRMSLGTSNQQSNFVNDQQIVHLNRVTAAEVLKSELIDDNSQNTLEDVMHTSETLVGCSIANPQNSNSLQYHNDYRRKSSIDAIIYESNGIKNFPVTTTTPSPSSVEAAVVAAAVEMAVKNEIAKAVSVAKVDKFINDLATSTNVEDNVVNVPQPTLFPVNNSNIIDHALTNILQQASVVNTTSNTGNVLEHALTTSKNSLPSTQNSTLPSCSSPIKSLVDHNSTITHDIIMSSEPSVTLNASVPIQQLIPSTQPISAVNVANDVSANNPSNISTEIIINSSSVSPSTILCSDNGAATAVVPNIMTPHQVTMANSILNDIAMQPLPTQQDAAVAALAISNIILTPPPTDNSAVSPAPSLQQEVPSATTTAVSNMIIKAAAELISNQEQQQTQQQQLHHQKQEQQSKHISQNCNTQLMNNQTVAVSDPLNSLNILLKHANVTAASQTGVNINNALTEVPSQFPLAISAAPQESLIIALATESPLQKSVTAAAITANCAVVTQETPSSSNNLHTTVAAVGAVAAVAAVAAVQPTIPQEITTMSDQDLISYINPSTFDQI